MIIFIKPQLLRNRINNRGPYLYYYNSKTNDDNSKILQYINKFACLYNNIDILEIDWNDYKKFQPDVKDTEINTIHLYYDGFNVMKENNPNNEKLVEIFRICIKLYDDKTLIMLNDIEKKYKNIKSIMDEGGLKIDNKNKIRNQCYQLKFLKNKLCKNFIKLPTKMSLNAQIFSNSISMVTSTTSYKCNNVNKNNKTLYSSSQKRKFIHYKKYKDIKNDKCTLLNNDKIYFVDEIYSSSKIFNFKTNCIIPKFNYTNENSKIIIKK